MLSKRVGYSSYRKVCTILTVGLFPLLLLPTCWQIELSRMNPARIVFIHIITEQILFVALVALGVLKIIFPPAGLAEPIRCFALFFYVAVGAYTAELYMLVRKKFRLGVRFRRRLARHLIRSPPRLNIMRRIRKFMPIEATTAGCLWR